MACGYEFETMDMLERRHRKIKFEWTFLPKRRRRNAKQKKGAATASAKARKTKKKPATTAAAAAKRGTKTTSKRPAIATAAADVEPFADRLSGGCNRTTMSIRVKESILDLKLVNNYVAVMVVFVIAILVEVRKEIRRRGVGHYILG